MNININIKSLFLFILYALTTGINTYIRVWFRYVNYYEIIYTLYYLIKTLQFFLYLFFLTNMEVFFFHLSLLLGFFYRFIKRLAETREYILCPGFTRQLLFLWILFLYSTCYLPNLFVYTFSLFLLIPSII